MIGMRFLAQASLSVLCLAAVAQFSSPSILAQSNSHDEEIVRNAYGTLSFLCELKPLGQVAVKQLHNRTVSQQQIDVEIANATPVFEITHIETGTISSIAKQGWSHRFSVPDPNRPKNVVLVGSLGHNYFTNETKNSNWQIASVKWGVDNSYTTERMAMIEALTVGKAVKDAETGAAWTPGKYDRYATFEVRVTFQGKTIGPYTASFFFGKDSAGNEVVAPQDAFVGDVLWSVIHLHDAYPAALLTSKLREQPSVRKWVEANKANTCSASRSDLCCSGGKCALPEMYVTRDLASPAEPERNAQ